MFLGVGKSKTKLVPNQVLDRIKKVLSTIRTARVDKFVYRHDHLFLLMDYRTKVCWMDRYGRILTRKAEEPYVIGINKWDLYPSRDALIFCDHQINCIPWVSLETESNEVSCTTYSLNLLSYYFTRKYPLISDNKDLCGFFTFTAYNDSMDAFLIDIVQKKAVRARIKRPESKTLDFSFIVRLNNCRRRIRVKVDGEHYWLKLVKNRGIGTDIVMAYDSIHYGASSTERKPLYLSEVEIMRVMADSWSIKWNVVG